MNLLYLPTTNGRRSRSRAELHPRSGNPAPCTEATRCETWNTRHEVTALTLGYGVVRLTMQQADLTLMAENSFPNLLGTHCYSNPFQYLTAHQGGLRARASC